MNLTEHFSLEEMTFSQTAERDGIDNVPGPEELANLRRVAEKMEEVRSLLSGIRGREISVKVNSGYRSRALNAAVPGSSNTSAHTFGCACDFIAPDFGTPYDVACAIRDAGVVFDQLIYEFTWVHIGLPTPIHGPIARGQCLTLKRGGGYQPGIVA